MSSRIHATAVIDPEATLGDNLDIGPFAYIGPDVTIGDGCVLDARATLTRSVRLGSRVHVGTGAALGGPPQDVKYAGNETLVIIGDDTHIGEYSTVNRATKPDGVTSVGRGCYLMTYVHVAHDCQLGDGIV